MDDGTKAFIDSLEKLEKQDKERSQDYKRESDLRNISIIAGGIASKTTCTEFVPETAFKIYQQIVYIYDKS